MDRIGTDERFPAAQDVVRERFHAPSREQHVHNRTRELTKAYLATHVREPHEHGRALQTVTQLLQWTTEELLALHDKMHRGEICSKCGKRFDDPMAHYPAALGGGCMDVDDASCPMCGGEPGECERWCELARLDR